MVLRIPRIRTSLNGSNATFSNSMPTLKPDGLLWICYPKGGSRVKTDLNRDILWEEMKKYKLAGVAMVSVDNVWSAMRFRPAENVRK